MSANQTSFYTSMFWYRTQLAVYVEEKQNQSGATSAAAAAFLKNKGGAHAACYGMIAYMNFDVFLASFHGYVGPKC